MKRLLIGYYTTKEAARILGQSIDFSRRGQLALRRALGKDL